MFPKAQKLHMITCHIHEISQPTNYFDHFLFSCSQFGMIAVWYQWLILAMVLDQMSFLTQSGFKSDLPNAGHEPYHEATREARQSVNEWGVIKVPADRSRCSSMSLMQLLVLNWYHEKYCWRLREVKMTKMPTSKFWGRDLAKRYLQVKPQV